MKETNLELFSVNKINGYNKKLATTTHITNSIPRFFEYKTKKIPS